MENKNDDDFDKKEWEYFCKKYKKYCVQYPHIAGKSAMSTLQWANYEEDNRAGLYCLDGKEETFYSKKYEVLNG